MANDGDSSVSRYHFAAECPKHRPRRPAAARRAQQARSDARMIQRFLSGIDSLQSHRGSQVSRLSNALAMVLRNGQTETRQRSPREHMPICKHYRRGVCTWGDACKFKHEAIPVPQAQTVQKMVEVPQGQAGERAVPVLQHFVQEGVREVAKVVLEVGRLAPVPQVQQTVEKVVDVPLTHMVEKVIPVPQVQVQEVPQRHSVEVEEMMERGNDPAPLGEALVSPAQPKPKPQPQRQPTGNIGPQLPDSIDVCKVLDDEELDRIANLCIFDLQQVLAHATEDAKVAVALARQRETLEDKAKLRQVGAEKLRQFAFFSRQARAEAENARGLVNVIANMLEARRREALSDDEELEPE